MNDDADLDIEAWYNGELAALRSEQTRRFCEISNEQPRLGFRAQLEAQDALHALDADIELKRKRIDRERRRRLEQAEKDKRNVVKRARRAWRKARGQ